MKQTSYPKGLSDPQAASYGVFFVLAEDKGLVLGFRPIDSPSESRTVSGEASEIKQPDRPVEMQSPG